MPEPSTMALVMVAAGIAAVRLKRGVR
ncbi:MAG: PEP-CTERM sorting domain-containing protein [Pirellulales bacterium]